MQPARLPPGHEWSAVVVGAGGGAVVGAGAVVGPGVGAGVVVVVVGTVKMCALINSCLFIQGLDIVINNYTCSFICKSEV